MKTLKFFGITLIGIMLLYACEKQDDEIISANDVFQKSGELGANHETEMVTVPFKATFTVWRALPPGTGECEEGSSRETMMMKGEGEMAHLGQLREIFFTFCTNSQGAYSNSSIGVLNKFVAANGDELYVNANGQIMLYTGDNPEYQFYFNDDLIFTGGTGRFVGASGSAKTNAYVHAGTTDNDGDDPFYTDFFMNEGTLTLMKGN